MPVELNTVHYGDLTSRQQESYNFQKVSSLLADYGYATLRLTDDWQGADFIAQHIDGVTFLKVQLKSRLTFNKKYLGKDLCVAFPHNEQWYLSKHDELLPVVLEATNFSETASWNDRGGYSWGKPGNKLLAILEPYRIDARTHGD